MISYLGINSIFMIYLLTTNLATEYIIFWMIAGGSSVVAFLIL